MKNVKKYIISFLTIIIFILCIFTMEKVKAVVPPTLPGMTPPEIDLDVICNVGGTDGLLYSSEWKFYVAKIPPLTGKEPNYVWEYSHSQMRICPSGGCSDTGDYYVGAQKGQRLTGLFNHQYFSNIYATGGGSDSTYTNTELETALKAGKCPSYIYVGSSSSKKKIGFIFSSEPLSNAKDLFEAAGYKVNFEGQADDLTEKSKKAYEDQVAEMKQKIQTFKDKNWGNVWDDDCDSFSNFGAISFKENITILYYEKYKEELFKANPNYDFSAGEKILAEYKSMKCAAKTSDDSSNNTNPDDNNDIDGDRWGTKDDFIGNLSCGNTSFQFHKSLPNFTNVIFDLLKIVTPIIIIITGMLDMFKAVSAQKEDEIKKSQQKLLRRLLAGAVLFLVFVIVQAVIHAFAETQEAENAWDCVDCFLVDSDSCTRN